MTKPDYVKPPDVIESVLPSHECSILAGASGAGKTTLLLEIVKLLQQNKPVFGFPATRGIKIGFIAADRTWEAYKKTAQLVGVDVDQLYVRAIIDDDDINIKELESNPSATLYNLMNDTVHHGCDLIIVDPLAVLLGCDLNKYHVVAAKLIQLNRYCRTNRVTLLGTHHATKARTESGFKRPQDRINGSGALLGFTSTQLFMSSPDENNTEYTQWHIVSHHAPPMTLHFTRNSKGTFEQANIPDLKVQEDIVELTDQWREVIDEPERRYEGMAIS